MKKIVYITLGFKETSLYLKMKYGVKSIIEARFGKTKNKFRQIS